MEQRSVIVSEIDRCTGPGDNGRVETARGPLVTEPVTDDGGSSLASLRWMAVAAVSIATVLALLPDVRLSPAADPIAPVDSRGVAPPLGAPLPATPQALEAVAIAEQLVAAVNSADSARVIELLAPTAFGSGLGDSEWPTAYGGLGWWRPVLRGAVLDEDAVTDFVRYFRTLPGGVVTTSCAADSIGGSERFLEVVCGFSAFGGIRGLMGDRERSDVGELTIRLRDRRIVDVAAHSEVNDAAWLDLAAWLSEHDEGLFHDVFGGGVELLPLYDGTSAMVHAAAAAAYAEAQGVASLPFG